MSNASPAVALLFDDTALGSQLREALCERGARIVHEGEVCSLSRELLERVGADVLVVNLDDSADDALDQLYEMIDGDRPRVVFNDAQASRGLAGWDRARWARHLAVKVLAAGDVDPPRPEDARLIDTPMPAFTPDVMPVQVQAIAAVEHADVTDDADPDAGVPDSSVPPVFAHDASSDYLDVPSAPAPNEFSAFDAFDGLDDLDSVASQDEQLTSAESENLAAELEALLASGELPGDDEEEVGTGLRFVNDEEMPALHDGHFGEAVSAQGDTSADSSGHGSGDLSSAATPPMFDLDHLQLSALTDDSVATIPAGMVEPVITHVTPPVQAPQGWALLDDDAEAAKPATPAQDERLDAATFGIEKLSAADFLAPDVEQAAPGSEALMSLELVSMEEAIAPQAYVQHNEMLLDDRGTALSRVVLLGAAVSGIDSACSFLAALPATTRLTFLHTQHVGDQSDSALVEKFAAHCALPVRLATSGRRAAAGEVVVVPAGQQVRLRRDGTIELQAIGGEGSRDPSIDASLTMAAGAFGRDALAIVFAGRGNDAVAGAQAIHDRGGQVWVESSSGEHFADMVSGIFAERLVSFSGTPPELAAHLIEVFP